MNVTKLLAKVGRERPMVAELARALSLAAHVDVSVVRRMRRELVRTADVTAEIDLWSSPLVQSRHATELALRADVIALLWQELADDGASLEKIWQVLDGLRIGAPPLLRLEERLTYLGIKRDTAAIGDALDSVLGAMLHDESRRRDLAAWSARALARLPAAVRETETARVLAAAARGWVATPTQVAELVPTPEGARLAARLRPRPTKRVAVAIRRVGNVLEVGGSLQPLGVSIELPEDAPTLIIDEDRVYKIDPRAVTRLPVSHPEVMLGASDGRRWLLVPEPKRPNLDAVAIVADPSRASEVAAAYLVAPTLAVTSAQFVHIAQFILGRLWFGSMSVSATVIAVDEDADLMLLRLDRSPPVPVLALATEVRQGEPWQIYPRPSGLTRADSQARPESHGEGWAGTVTTAWPSVMLRISDEWPERVPLPGMPIFCGDRVIGHWQGDPKFGEWRITPARLIQWWIDKVGSQESELRAVVMTYYADGESRPGVAVQPGIIVVFDPPGTDAEVEHGVLRERMKAKVVQRMGAIGLLLPERHWPGETARVGFGFQQEAPMLLVTVDKVWPVDAARMKYRQVVNSEIADILVAYDREEPRCPRGAAFFSNGRLMGFLMHEGDDEVIELPHQLGAWLVSRGAPRSGPVRVWITLTDENVPSELILRGSADAQLGDRVIAFSGARRRLKWPAGLYEVVSLNNSGESVSILCNLMLAIPRPEERLLHRVREETNSLTRLASARNYISRDIGLQVIELLRRLHDGGPIPEQAARLLAPAIENDSGLGKRVALVMPEQISTSGVLGTSITHEGNVRRFRSFFWGIHEILISTGPGWPSDADIRVSIIDAPDGDLPLGVDIVPEIGGDRSLSDPCMRAALMLNLGTDIHQAPKRSSVDLTIGVRALRALPRAWAYRRGLRYLTAVLEELDGAPERHLFLHVPGSGAHDLCDAQRRLRSRRADGSVTIVAIDGETDGVEIGLRPSETRTTNDAIVEVGWVFGAPIETIHVVRASVDALYGRFGVSNVRSGRELTITVGERVAVVVAPTDARPVRGYVTFYAPRHVIPEPIRVRAREGLAYCSLPHGQYTVGAIIEDEGVALEGHLFREEPA